MLEILWRREWDSQRSLVVARPGLRQTLIAFVVARLRLLTCLASTRSNPISII